MPSYVLTDGTSVVSLNPYYDIVFSGSKVESSHRTRAGKNYRYLWGQYSKLKMTVSELSSADKTQVNSWWGANVALKLYDISSAVVSSSYIANATTPIDRYVPPYTDLFMGVIELEGY